MDLKELLREVTPGTQRTIVDRTMYASDLFGTNGDDWIIAGDGGDRIYSEAGDDFISKSVGHGTIDGGPGTDTLYLRDILNGYDPVAIYEVDLIYEEAFLDWAPVGNFETYLFNIENVAGSVGEDEFYGDHGPNVLAGYAGDDVLDGRGGPDALWGGAGTDDLMGGQGADYLHGGRGSLDFLEGGPGHDTIDGGGGDDVALYLNADRIEVAHIPGTENAFVVTEGKWVDRLTNIEEIWGSDGSDLYRLGASDTSVDAEAGSDTIHGGAGEDFLGGGTGKDFIFGGADADSFLGDIGRDRMWGDGWAAGAADHFFFEPSHTAEVFRGQADVIHDFDDQDTIVLISQSDLEFQEGSRMPGLGMYTVFDRGEAHVVRWQEMSGSIHDVVVRGDDPTDQIDTIMFDTDGGWSYGY